MNNIDEIIKIVSEICDRRNVRFGHWINDDLGTFNFSFKKIDQGILLALSHYEICNLPKEILIEKVNRNIDQLEEICASLY